MAKALVAFLHDQTGATAIEYAVMACLLSVVLVTAMRSIGTDVGVSFRHALAAMAL